MGAEDERDEDGNYSLFQSSIYRCSRCGTEYRTHHPVLVAMLVAGVCVVVAALRRAVEGEQVLMGLVMLAVVGAAVAHEIFKWFRYPEVK